MLAEIGLIFLLVAMTAALFQLVCIFASYQWVERLSILQVTSVLLSYLILSFCFIADDFTVQYVAHSSNSTLPWYYKLTAVWGAHEGSLLLWLAVLNFWYLALYIVARKSVWSQKLSIYTFWVMGLVNLGLLILLVHTSNPFARYMLNPPLDGADLNPMLQDLAMIIHPPVLYIGYVGTVAAFAITMASLWQQKVDSNWANLVRPWVQTAWVFLTLGIALGSWWAYYELGWGGWWFWDPVENASFMPWLTATALLHCLGVAARRGKFLGLAVLLVISTFSLSIFGTFLVRSGIISSVHAFAHDPVRGKLIVQLLLCWGGSAIFLFVRRYRSIAQNAKWNKTDVAIVINNILLLLATLSILLGTIYPLFPIAGVSSQDGVGVEYYNAVFIPIMIAMLLAMLGTFFKLRSILILLPLMVFVSCLSLWFLFGFIKFYACLGVSLALCMAASVVTARSKFMLFAHLGLAITIIGVSVNANYEQEIELLMSSGEQYTFAKHVFYMQNVHVADGPNYITYQANIKMDDSVYLQPEKRMYLTRELVLNEIAIEPGLFNDIYLVLGQNIAEGVWAVRIAIKPFVRWIWAGVLVMVSGFLLEIFGKIFVGDYYSLVRVYLHLKARLAH